MDHVTRTAKKGSALPIIGKLRYGYYTILGKTFDDSVELSGSKWQKHALSRVYAG